MFDFQNYKNATKFNLSYKKLHHLRNNVLILHPCSLEQSNQLSLAAISKPEQVYQKLISLRELGYLNKPSRFILTIQKTSYLPETRYFIFSLQYR
ncbi:hypothetical protein ACJIZ3_008547 [Penstemon smallii]|uniref:Uncharacterized protein n=1 Tax=Penstemon smallii TaxID=265156 RepID=A0ABD3TA20_9LAMI